MVIPISFIEIVKRVFLNSSDVDLYMFMYNKGLEQKIDFYIYVCILCTYLLRRNRRSVVGEIGHKVKGKRNFEN